MDQGEFLQNIPYLEKADKVPIRAQSSGKRLSIFAVYQRRILQVKIQVIYLNQYNINLMLEKFERSFVVKLVKLGGRFPSERYRCGLDMGISRRPKSIYALIRPKN